MVERELFDSSIYETVPSRTPVTLEKDPYRNWQSEVINWPHRELPIEIDNDRFDTVLVKLLDEYTSRRGIFEDSGHELPHAPENMPKTLERGSKDHATFHFMCCLYMRGGIASSLAYRLMSEIYDERPEFFDTEHITSAIGSIDDLEDGGRQKMIQDISELTQSKGMGFHNTNPKWWVEDAVRLQTSYDGDPRNIFSDVTNYQELVKRVKNDGAGGGFIGFDKKMASMIAYYLIDDGLIEKITFPPPIDFHVSRVSIATEMVRFPGVPENTQLFREQLTDTLREAYLEFMKRNNVDPLVMSEPVWLLSLLLCSNSPGNKTFEPNRKKGEKGRSAVLIPQIADPENPSHIAAYDKSCRVCPVEAHCTKNIGATLYFRAGGVAIRGARLRFPPHPQGKIFE